MRKRVHDEGFETSIHHYESVLTFKVEMRLTTREGFSLHDPSCDALKKTQGSEL